MIIIIKSMSFHLPNECWRLELKEVALDSLLSRNNLALLTKWDTTVSTSARLQSLEFSLDATKAILAQRGFFISLPEVKCEECCFLMKSNFTFGKIPIIFLLREVGKLPSLISDLGVLF